MLLKRLSILLLTTGCILSLSACGKKNVEPDVSGNMEVKLLEDLEEPDEEIDTEELQEDVIKETVTEDDDMPGEIAVQSDYEKIDEPGMYAVVLRDQYEVKLYPKSKEKGINDETKIGNMNSTFGDMCKAAQQALEEGRTFPSELFRQIISCELVGPGYVSEGTTDMLLTTLSYNAALANNFHSLDVEVTCMTVKQSNPDVRIFDVYINGASQPEQVWEWNVRTGEFKMNGHTDYISTMFDDETISTWRFVFQSLEEVGLGV